MNHYSLSYNIIYINSYITVFLFVNIRLNIIHSPTRLLFNFKMFMTVNITLNGD